MPATQGVGGVSFEHPSRPTSAAALGMESGAQLRPPSAVLITTAQGAEPHDALPSSQPSLVVTNDQLRIRTPAGARLGERVGDVVGDGWVLGTLALVPCGDWPTVDTRSADWPVVISGTTIATAMIAVSAARPPTRRRQRARMRSRSRERGSASGTRMESPSFRSCRISATERLLDRFAKDDGELMSCGRECGGDRSLRHAHYTRSLVVRKVE